MPRSFSAILVRAAASQLLARSGQEHFYRASENGEGEKKRDRTRGGHRGSTPGIGIYKARTRARTGVVEEKKRARDRGGLIGTRSLRESGETIGIVLLGCCLCLSVGYTVLLRYI